MWNKIIAQFGAHKAEALKVAGFIVGGVLLLVFVQALTTNSVMLDRRSVSMDAVPSAPPGGGSFEYAERDGYESGTSLSMRNVMGTMPQNQGYASGDEEAFEIKQYSALIRTGALDRDCRAIEDLKTHAAIIFTESSRYERGCTYTFKVERAQVADVLARINTLNPREVNEHVYTIKREVDDYTSEIDIYRSKLASLDATLAEALASYENITALATKTGDTESLARIIESKLSLIERLTSARVAAQNDLDRIARAKAEALDRLTYTYFSVTISEEVFVDREALVESWKSSIRQLVWDINAFLGDITIGIAGLVFFVLKIALYGVILLGAARVGWKVVKHLWNG